MFNYMYEHSLTFYSTVHVVIHFCDSLCGLFTVEANLCKFVFLVDLSVFFVFNHLR